VLYTTAIFLIGGIWVEAFRSVATFFGLLSAGVAIALRDQIANLAAWLFIAWERPFQVGDRVQIGSLAGDVIDQRAFLFTLLEIGNWVDADQTTGRVVHVPNGKIFTEPLVNYNQGLEYIWNEVSVTVTFESNWRKAKSILEEIAERHGRALSEEEERQVLSAVRRFMIHFSTLKPIVYTSLKEHGVRLTLRYICDPRRRRGSAEKIYEEILSEFARHGDIAYAYPTHRIVHYADDAVASVRAGGGD
jgi:small-conductance mechanosensitive channel